MTKDSDSTRRIDILLGGVRAAIRKADEAFRPDPDAALYVGTDDGRINLANLLALAPMGMDPGDFERRVSILYNGNGEQRHRMLDHWGDPDYMYDLVSEVEDSGHALSYDLFRCEDWDESTTAMTSVAAWTWA